MKKSIILSTIAIFCLQSCKKSSNAESQMNNESIYVDTFAVQVDTGAITEQEIIHKQNTSTSKTESERNKKLISAFKDMPQTIDADVYKDILTIRVTIVTKGEAQKIADGIFEQIKKYPENDHIKTVMVVDAKYILLGYAGKK